MRIFYVAGVDLIARYTNFYAVLSVNSSCGCATPHVLRHTCATLLLQLGVSVYDVAGVLGASENVVRRTYGHHAHDHLRHAVAAFSRRHRAHETPMKSVNKRGQKGKISPNGD